MKTQTKETPRQTAEGLGNLSQDLLIEIHHQIKQSSRADEVQVSESRVLGKEGMNTLVRLGYSAFGIGFSQGEYECTAVLDERTQLVEVRDVKYVS